MLIGPQSSICHATLVHKKYSIKEALFEDVSGGFACQPSCLGIGFLKENFPKSHASFFVAPALIGSKPKKKPVRSHIPPSVMADAKKILDVLAPIRSGKVYRIVSCPLNYLYEQYRAPWHHR